MRVVAPVSGTSREVSDVPDPVFSSGAFALKSELILQNEPEEE